MQTLNKDITHCTDGNGFYRKLIQITNDLFVNSHLWLLNLGKTKL